MAVKTVDGRVVSQKAWNDRLHSLRIEAEFDPFAAGQFGRIGLEIDGEQVMRPYSFVNAPDGRPHEFHYIRLDDGPLTNRLVRLRPGDPILVSPKPNGFLVLAEVPDSGQLWMMSSGTAVGPFLSILGTEDPWERFESLVLVHAVRHVRDLSYREEAEALASSRPGRLRYIPVISRADTGFSLRGRIPALLASGELQRRAGLDVSPGRSQFMLCGNPDMVRDTTAQLREMGFERNRRRKPGHITVENYW